MAFQILFAMAAYDVDIDQMNIKIVFIHDLLDQLIYVKLPKDMDAKANKNMVCKLLKALYSLKQSPYL